MISILIVVGSALTIAYAVTKSIYLLEKCGTPPAVVLAVMVAASVVFGLFLNELIKVLP